MPLTIGSQSNTRAKMPALVWIVALLVLCYPRGGLLTGDLVGAAATATAAAASSPSSSLFSQGAQGRARGVDVESDSGWPSDFDVFTLHHQDDRAGGGEVPMPIRRLVIHDRLPLRTSWGTFVAHGFVASDPFNNFAVMQPPGGCSSGNRSTPLNTAFYRFPSAAPNHISGGRSGGSERGKGGSDCDVVTSGGFFDPDTASITHGRCIGALVSDGEWAAGGVVTHNAMLGVGVAPDGRRVLVVGHLNASQVHHSFKWAQLVTGVVWLVRGGQSFVEESLETEDFSTQRSGSGEHFVELRAPRLALGVDHAHRLVLVAVDGSEPHYEGVGLRDFAEILIRMGVQAAINLDGGGSVSVFDRDVLVNIPSDTCAPEDAPPLEALRVERALRAKRRMSRAAADDVPTFKCPRRVASALCLQSGSLFKDRVGGGGRTPRTLTKSPTAAPPAHPGRSPSNHQEVTITASSATAKATSTATLSQSSSITAAAAAARGGTGGGGATHTATLPVPSADNDGEPRPGTAEMARTLSKRKSWKIAGTVLGLVALWISGVVLLHRRRRQRAAAVRGGGGRRQYYVAADAGGGDDDDMFVDHAQLSSVVATPYADGEELEEEDRAGLLARPPRAVVVVVAAAAAAASPSTSASSCDEEPAVAEADIDADSGADA